MADQKISELDAKTTPVAADLLAIVDSEAGPTTKKITFANLVTAPIAATKIDDLTAGDDNTDLNANTTNHGLLLKAVAPAAGTINVPGIANGETVYTQKSIIVADIGDGFALDGIITTTEDAAIQLQPALTTDHHWNGLTRLCTCGAAAHIAIGEVCYMAATGLWELAKGDAYATAAGQLVMATSAADHDGTTTFIGLLPGGYFLDATFDLTVGGEVWISKATAGLITKTQPTTPAFLRCLGSGDDDADTLYFNPSPVVVEI